MIMKIPHLPILCLWILCLFHCINAQNNTVICKDETTCRARGVCITDNADPKGWYCLCDDGYTTYPEPGDDADTEDLIYCNYQQKDQLVAFLLSFFVGFFAAGRFYVEDFTMAGIKIALNVGMGCIFSICLSCVVGVGGCFASRGSNRGAGGVAACLGCFASLYFCLVALAIIGWMIADWVLFGMNDILDGNGVELKPW